MAPKKRHQKNTDLIGTNIKIFTKKDKEYFYYVMPNGELQALVHGDRKQSIEVAHMLNRELRQSGNVFQNIIQKATTPAPKTSNPLLPYAADEFFSALQSKTFNNKTYSENTLAGYRQLIDCWKNEWPHEKIGSFDTYKVSSYLRSIKSQHQAKRNYSLFNQFFRFVASNGYETQKPMIDIVPISQPKAKRARHTWEGI